MGLLLLLLLLLWQKTTEKTEKQQQSIISCSSIMRIMIIKTISPRRQKQKQQLLLLLPPAVALTSIQQQQQQKQQQQQRQRFQKLNSIFLLLLSFLILSIQQFQCYAFVPIIHHHSTKNKLSSIIQKTNNNRNKISLYYSNINNSNNHYHYHHYLTNSCNRPLLLQKQSCRLLSSSSSSSLSLSSSSKIHEQQHQQEQQKVKQKQNKYYPNNNNNKKNRNNPSPNLNNNNDDDCLYDPDHMFVNAIRQEYNLPKIQSSRYIGTTTTNTTKTRTKEQITTAMYNSLLQLLQRQLSNLLSKDNNIDSNYNYNTNNKQQQILQLQTESIIKYGVTAEKIVRYMITKQQQQQQQQQYQKPNQKTIHLVLDIYRIICSPYNTNINNNNNKNNNLYDNLPDTKQDSTKLSSSSSVLDSTGSLIGATSSTSTTTTTTTVTPIKNIGATVAISAAQAANNLLNEWENIWYPNRYVLEPPDVAAYNIVMSCYNEIGYYQQVETIFEQGFFVQQQQQQKKIRQQQQQQDGTLNEQQVTLNPNIISYNCLLKAYSMSGQIHRAQELLQNMIRQQQKQDSSISKQSITTTTYPKPTIHSFNTVLYAYAKSKYYHPLLAHKFLLEWLTQTTTTTTSSSSTTTATARTSITAASSNENDTIVYPNTYSYNIVLHAMTQAIRHENQSRRSNLNEKKDVSKEKINKSNLSQNKITNNSKRGYNPKDTRLTPSVVPAYNRPIDTVKERNHYMYDDETTAALSSDPDFIIHRTQTLFDSIPLKDVISYTSLIAAYCETIATTKSSGTITSNRRSYDNSNNNNKGSKNPSENNGKGRDIQQTLDIVRNIVNRAYTDESIQVTASFISNVIYSLTVIEDVQAALLADELVQSMIQQYNVQPTVSLYNALIYCWGKSAVSVSSSNPKYSTIDNIQRIFDIVKTMESSSSSSGLQPNTITYTNVLDALKVSITYATKTTQSTFIVDAAEKLLTQMENQYQQHQQQDHDGPVGRSSLLYTVRPSIATYTTMIQIYGRSRVPFKAIKAANIIRRMNSTVHVQPNIITYNAVLNACEFTDPSSDATIIEAALKVACEVFDEVRSSITIQANHVTYASFIGVLGTLIPSSSNTKLDIIQVIFRKCCSDGQVSKLVLKKLRTAISSNRRYQEDLLQGYKEDSLPSDWSRNVPSENIKARQYL